MKLDHINLTVDDVTQSSGFLKKHFGFVDAFDDNSAGMAALRGPDGMHVLLMKGSNPAYPKYFHVGFDPGSEAGVNAMYEQLKGDGVVADPPEHAWGSWTFHFTCPGGKFAIEVACTSE